jgi:hypothetical protein
MTPRAFEFPTLVRLSWLVLALAVTVLATGCTTPTKITTDASSFGKWPPEREPGTFAFERLPSQEAQAPAQEKLEAAASAALQRAGFKPAASAAEADVLVVAGTRLTTISAYDPFYYPWGPRYYFSGSVGYKHKYYRRHRGYYGAFWGYPGYYPYGSAQVLEVSLTMRDRKTQEIVHEAGARYDRPWGDPRLVEALFDAALKGFPTPSSRRAVTVPLPAAAEAEEEAAAAAEDAEEPAAKEAPAAPAAPQAPASAPAS